MSVVVHVIEDNPYFSTWIRSVLDRLPDLAQIRGLQIGELPEIEIEQSSHAAGAGELVEKDLMLHRPPGMVVLDLVIPQREDEDANADNGFDVLEMYRQAGYEVIVFSRYATIDNLSELLNRSASGFVAKPDFPDDAFAQTLAAVLAGHLKRVAESRLAKWEACRHQFKTDWQLGQSYLQLTNELVSVVEDGLSDVEQRICDATRLSDAGSAPSQLTQQLAEALESLEQISTRIRRVRSGHLGVADLQTADTCTQVDLRKTVSRIVRRLDPGIVCGELRVDVDFPADASYHLNHYQRPIEFLLSGLLFHAVDQSPPRGRIGLSMQSTEDDSVELQLRIPIELDEKEIAVLRGVRDAVLPDDALWGLRLIRRVLQSVAGRIGVSTDETGTMLRVELPGVTDGASALDRIR